MSLHEYEVARELALHDHPFYAFIQVAMRQADTDNLVKLKFLWPEVWEELQARYNSPGGILEEERQ